MSDTTKTVLIVGGVGVVVYMLFRATAAAAAPAPAAGTFGNIANLAKGVFGAVVSIDDAEECVACDSKSPLFNATKCEECRRLTPGAKQSGVFNAIADLATGIVGAFS